MVKKKSGTLGSVMGDAVASRSPIAWVTRKLRFPGGFFDQQRCPIAHGVVDDDFQDPIAKVVRTDHSVREAVSLADQLGQGSTAPCLAEGLALLFLQS